MTSDEFLKHYLEYQKQRYEKFNQYQQIAFETLVEFNRVCRMCGVQYFLAYGTLLGAIRDMDMIPWDYDVDTFIFFKDKDRLIAALEKNLGDDYYYLCAASDKSCRHYIIRICRKGFDSAVMHVDVFFLIGSPNDAEAFKRRGQALKRVCEIRYSKLVDAKAEAMGNRARYIVFLLNKVRYCLVPLGYLNKRYNKLCTSDPVGNSAFLMSGDIFGIERRYNLEWFSATYEVEMRGISFPIPMHYDDVLKSNYGDYTQYPSIESNSNEFEVTLKRMEYFGNRTKK